MPLTFAEWIESLKIFAKYAPEGMEAMVNLHPEHDEIFMGPNPAVVSPEDNARLEELRWHPSDYESYYRFT